MAIINIPINVNDDLFNNAIERDYEQKIFQELIKRVENALCEKAGYGYYKRPENGIIVMAEEAVDKVISENKDIIIEKASDKLAERLAKTKKAKLAVEDVCEKVL